MNFRQARGEPGVLPAAPFGDRFLRKSVSQFPSKFQQFSLEVSNSIMAILAGDVPKKLLGAEKRKNLSNETEHIQY